MEKESFRDILPALFSDIFRKTVDPKFNLPLPVIKQTTDPFIDRFDGSDTVNVGNYVDYIIHQCYVWKDWNKWKDRFALSWVFGIKAIERYQTAKQGAKYYQDLWLSDLKLNRNTIKGSVLDPKKEHPMRKFVDYPSDDYSKERFLNTEDGYVMCVTETLMWSPSSKPCSICKYVSKCKVELSKQYPELLRLREESIKNKQ